MEEYRDFRFFCDRDDNEFGSIIGAFITNRENAEFGENLRLMQGCILHMARVHVRLHN